MYSSKKDYDDILFIKKAKQEVELGIDELVPLNIMKKLLTNESKLKIWREYRGITLEELSSKTNISLSVISKIESNNQQIDLSKINLFSKVLRLNYDDLIG